MMLKTVPKCTVLLASRYCVDSLSWKGYVYAVDQFNFCVERESENEGKGESAVFSTVTCMF